MWNEYSIKCNSDLSFLLFISGIWIQIGENLFNLLHVNSDRKQNFYCILHLRLVKVQYKASFTCNTRTVQRTKTRKKNEKQGVLCGTWSTVYRNRALGVSLLQYYYLCFITICSKVQNKILLKYIKISLYCNKISWRKTFALPNANSFLGVYHTLPSFSLSPFQERSCANPWVRSPAFNFFGLYYYCIVDPISTSAKNKNTWFNKLKKVCNLISAATDLLSKKLNTKSDHSSGMRMNPWSATVSPNVEAISGSNSICSLLIPFVLNSLKTYSPF